MVRSVFLFSVVVLALSALSVCSCAGDRLAARVDLLEKELSDQRIVGKRLDARLDELQIQVTLMARKLEGRGAFGPGSKPAKVPDLKVFKLSPPLPMLKLDESGPRTRNGPAPGTGVGRALKPVDPAEVTERLAVDRPAARRSLMELEGEADANPPTEQAGEAEVKKRL